MRQVMERLSGLPARRSWWQEAVKPILLRGFFHVSCKPRKWVQDAEGEMVYGSITQECKAALEYLNTLYTRGVLDKRFLLRTSQNIEDLIKNGKCGAFFGKWWAPNNPLMESYDYDREAEWKPYFFTEQDENVLQEYETFEDRLYVVVRKGYEHPEIVAKYISVIFDYSVMMTKGQMK